MPQIVPAAGLLSISQIALAADQAPVTTAATTLGCDQNQRLDFEFSRSTRLDSVVERNLEPRRLLIRGGAGQKVPAGDDICPQPAGEVGRINQACDTAVLHETSVWRVIWRVDAGRGPAVTEDMGLGWPNRVCLRWQSGRVGTVRASTWGDLG